MVNILVTRSSMPSMDEYIKEIEDIWDSHWLTNMGPKHKEFQKNLKRVFKGRANGCLPMVIWLLSYPCRQ